MKYECKENDVVIEHHEDEIWIGVVGDDKCGKTVVGLKDLKQALNLFGVSKCEADSVCDYCGCSLHETYAIQRGKKICLDCAVA